MKFIYILLAILLFLYILVPIFYSNASWDEYGKGSNPIPTINLGSIHDLELHQSDILDSQGLIISCYTLLDINHTVKGLSCIH